MPRAVRFSLVLAALLASGCGGEASGDGTWGVEKGTYGDKDAAGTTETTITQAPDDDAPEAPSPQAETPAEAPTVSTPEPAPPVAPPPPSGDIVNRDDHVAFALDFLGRQTVNDVQGLMGLYGDRVRYFNRGTVSRSAVAEDKSNYFARWPNRYYEISGAVRATRGTNPSIRFDYLFEVSDARVTESRDGRAWVELTLSPGGGGYVITGERGGTY
ncbi:MAG: hypothetical protein AAFQ43_13680 [Bacteroidota bacterium]